MDPQVTSALIGGAFNTFSQGMGSIFQRRQNNIQRDYEREMYQRSVNDNRENWRMENLYNSPEQQMARLKAAGLNPNLVYGTGATAMGGTIDSQSPHVSDLSKNQSPYIQNMTNGIGNMVSQIYDLKLKDAQIDLMSKEMETQQTQANLNAQTTVLKSLESDKQSTENRYLAQTIRTNIAKTVQDMATSRSQSRLNQTHAELNTQMTRNAVDQNFRENQKQPLTLSQIATNIEQAKSQIQLNRSNIGLNAQHIKESEQNINLSKSHQALNELDQWLTEHGLSKNDNAVNRILKNGFYSYSENYNKLKEYVINALKSQKTFKTH